MRPAVAIGFNADGQLSTLTMTLMEEGCAEWVFLTTGMPFGGSYTEGPMMCMVNPLVLVGLAPPDQSGNGVPGRPKLLDNCPVAEFLPGAPLFSMEGLNHPLGIPHMMGFVNQDMPMMCAGAVPGVASSLEAVMPWLLYQLKADEASGAAVMMGPMEAQVKITHQKLARGTTLTVARGWDAAMDQPETIADGAGVCGPSEVTVHGRPGGGGLVAESHSPPGFPGKDCMGKDFYECHANPEWGFQVELSLHDGCKEAPWLYGDMCDGMHMRRCEYSIDDEVWRDISYLARHHMAFKGALRGSSTEGGKYTQWLCLYTTSQEDVWDCGVPLGALGCFRYEPMEQKMVFWGVNQDLRLVDEDMNWLDMDMHGMNMY